MFFILESRGIFANLNSFITNLILGDAYPILLMRTIYLNIKGKSKSLTPNPQPIKNGSQGTAVAAYSFIIQAAVNVKTGVK